MIVREGMLLDVAGVALGGLAALLLSRALQSQLYGVSAKDQVAKDLNAELAKTAEKRGPFCGPGRAFSSAVSAFEGRRLVFGVVWPSTQNTYFTPSCSSRIGFLVLLIVP